MGSSAIDFRALAAHIAASDGRSAMAPVIEKELLHYEILRVLDEARLLDALTFQGGTSLRLCYGADRYSEDLDFAAGNQFNSETLHDMKQTIEDSICLEYDVKVSVKEPLATREYGTEKVNIKHWEVRVDTAPARPDLPLQRISLQIASVPAYTRNVLPIKVRYPELPISYAGTLVFAESPEEICADKIIAFARSEQIRYRDLWDLRWLLTQPGFEKEVAIAFVPNKAADYHCERNFAETLIAAGNTIPALVETPEFRHQMERFLPQQAILQTLDRPSYRESLANMVSSLFKEVSQSL